MKFFNSKDKNGRTVIFSRDEISKIEYDDGKLNIGVNVYLKGSDAPLYVTFPDSKDLVEPTMNGKAFESYCLWKNNAGYIIDMREIAGFSFPSEPFKVFLKGGTVIELPLTVGASLKDKYTNDYLRYID